MPTAKRRCKDCAPGARRQAPYPGPRCREHHKLVVAARRDLAWERHLKTTYGITPEQYWSLYEAQGGRCYICQRATGARRKLAVDHDHATGEIRGLLDKACNRGVLGHLRDNEHALQRAIDYLEYPPAREVIGQVIVPSMTSNSGT